MIECMKCGVILSNNIVKWNENEKEIICPVCKNKLRCQSKEFNRQISKEEIVAEEKFQRVVL